ncbi:MAG: radical SAM protein, partial [Candidatus Dormibacteria bacterium]
HERIGRIAAAAAAWGVAEFWLTGGEPFLLADIADSIRACVAYRPTTVLTNGMLFRGARLERLQRLPRTDLSLQISLDSPSPERHDRVRGQGSWARAMAGIRTACDLGFHVRVAATVDPADRQHMAELAGFTAVLDEFGIDRDDLLIRPVARRGFAGSGLELAPDMLVPEVTITAGGVYWHPVGAADSDMLVDTEIFPLGERIDRVIDLFEDRARRLSSAALMFPCA